MQLPSHAHTHTPSGAPCCYTVDMVQYRWSVAKWDSRSVRPGEQAGSLRAGSQLCAALAARWLHLS